MSEVLIYQGKDQSIQIEVQFENDTVWLSQAQLVDLYQSSKANVSEHIKHIFEEGELEKGATVRNFRTVQKEGKRNVEREIEHYNLDMIISLGYRIKSIVATQFRIWATQRLKEYLVKGFTMNDERLKEMGGGNYWKELLDRIRDIRSSEKVMYRQVLDLYATAIDYNPKSDESVEFFKIVQNKLHFAAHGNTAAEVVYFRVDSDKPFAGLTNFKGSQPTQAEALIAKNYLQIEELRVLNNLVSAYFDLAEINAMEQKPMKMEDYIKQLDVILSSAGRKLLEDKGKISHEKAMERAKKEYGKYCLKNLSEVEKSYLETLKRIEKARKKG
jgi:hypothetical protein